VFWGVSWQTWLLYGAYVVGFLVVVLSVVMVFRFLRPVIDGAPVGSRLYLWKWLFQNKYWWFQRKKLEDLPSCIYEGLPGSGKTLAMVRDIVPFLRSGVRVGSNLRVRDALTGRETLPCRSWLEMLELTLEAVRDKEPLIIALDEIHNLCDAREWANTPAWWRNMMSQKRHFGLGLIGTTQALGQVEKRLRSLVSYLLRYERVGIGRLPLFREVVLDPGAIDVAGSQWQTKKSSLVWMPWYAFHSYSTWEVMASDDMTAYKDDELREKIAEMLEELRELCAVEGIPAFSDEIGGSGVASQSPDRGLVTPSNAPEQV